MQPEIYNLKQIKPALQQLDPIQAMEQGFVAYSDGRAVIPPVGELIFSQPPGDTHIKYGYIRKHEYYVIKIASGFYDNMKTGIPVGSGLMLIFSQRTGRLAAILLDQGHLTDVRTAAAGAVAAKFLAPKNVSRIGVLGAGVQGRMQVQYLSSLIPCRDVSVWDRNMHACDTYKTEMELLGYTVRPTRDAEEVAGTCNLIITATPAHTPLLKADWIVAGTHITAMGSDTPEKNELSPRILEKADIVVGDSLEQCRSRGEIFKAVTAGVIDMKKPVELGHVITGRAGKRVSDDQITVADLTGVAIQDIQSAVAVFQTLKSEKSEKNDSGGIL